MLNWKCVDGLDLVLFVVKEGEFFKLSFNFISFRESLTEMVTICLFIKQEIKSQKNPSFNLVGSKVTQLV